MDNDLDPPMINTLSRDILQFLVHIGSIVNLHYGSNIDIGSSFKLKQVHD